MRARTSASHAYGSTSLSLAVTMRVYIAAACPPAVGAGEQPRPSSQSDSAQRTLGGVLCQADAAIVKETGESAPDRSLVWAHRVRALSPEPWTHPAAGLENAAQTATPLPTLTIVIGANGAGKIIPPIREGGPHRIPTRGPRPRGLRRTAGISSRATLPGSDHR